MIGRLRGAIVTRGADGNCVLDVGGVGYELAVPVRTAASLPVPPGPAELHVHTHVREDAITLYGFDSAEDRVAFRLLLGVSGIGPKVALAVLGAMNAEELAIAVARTDKTRFRKIPGVGKKTIERLFLDLADRLPAFPAAAHGTQPAGPAPGSPMSVAVEALVQMGFKRVAAERAVGAVSKEGAEQTVETILRDALSSIR